MSSAYPTHHYLIVSIVSAIMLVSCGPAPESPLVGNDRDAHGCIGSAGYSWCEERKECLRIWETICDPALEKAIQSLLQKEESKNGDVTKIRPLQQTKTHALIGFECTPGSDTICSAVLAAKVNGQWEIHRADEASEETLISKYGFPQEMLDYFFKR